MGEDSGEGDIPLSLTLSRQGRENYDMAISRKDVGLLRFTRKDILLKPFL
jgi:hypothetical protein